jgi:GT2 family glycosyltransferase
VTASPPVSLIMPVYNRAHLSDRVLESLAEHTSYPNTELVVVDDGSTDGSVEILRRWRDSGRLPDMKLVEKPNRGAIDSLNRGLHESSGELCVQLDDDVTIETPGWVERMLDFMLLDEAVGVVTAKVVFDTGRLHACGVNVVGETGWHERPTHPSEPIGRRGWLSRVQERPWEGEGGRAEAEPAEVDSGIGCCMMYRRDDALAAGGYDTEWAPVWFDDVDLCLKLRVHGRKAFYLPDVKVIHHFQTRRAPSGALARLHPVRLAHMATTRAARLMPGAVVRTIERRLELDLRGAYSREQVARLRHHHEYWREKWGWDARNPDMEVIERRWGDTELWWARDAERRAAGERILRAYRERAGELALR